MIGFFKVHIGPQLDAATLGTNVRFGSLADLNADTTSTAALGRLADIGPGGTFALTESGHSNFRESSETKGS